VCQDLPLTKISAQIETLQRARGGGGRYAGHGRTDARSVEQSEEAGRALHIITDAVSRIRDGKTARLPPPSNSKVMPRSYYSELCADSDVTEQTVAQGTLLSAATSEGNDCRMWAKTLESVVSRLRT